MVYQQILVGTAGILALTASAAQAQVASEASEEAPIVVTAQLREQNPIDVPVAVTVLSGEELTRFGVEDFEEYGRFIPGFDVQNQSPNNPGFVMRGITSDSGTAYNEPRVSVFQDGVSISKSRGSFVELFDVERVEVSKGPQSTLYGRGALIGAVNIIQRKADPREFGAMARVDYGNYDSQIYEGMINAPLGDGVAVRVAGRYRKRDGTIENLLGGEDFNSADTAAVRGSFHAQTGGLTFDLIGNYQKDKPAGTSFKSLSYRPTDPVTGAVLGDSSPNSGAALAAGPGFPDGTRLGLDRKVWGVTGIANYALSDSFKLTSITAYRKFNALEVFDADGISLPVLTAAEDARGKQFSQEFRATYEQGPLTAFAGASYFWENGSQRAPAQFDERLVLARLADRLNGAVANRPASDPAPAALLTSPQFGGALLQGLVTQALIGRGLTPAQAQAQTQAALSAAVAQAIAANLNPALVESTTNFSRTRAFDVFGDVTLRVGERLELGAGLRYTHDDKRTGFAASLANGRSIISTFQYALGLTGATQQQTIAALATPGAATAPASALLPPLGLSTQATAGNGGRDNADLTDDGLSWRLTARYAVSPEASLYANYARGRRPRVLSPQAPAAPLGATIFAVLPNERVDSWEAGFKTALAARTLFLDGAVFYYDYKNFQTVEQQGTRFVTTNAGHAESYGFEGQARWVPSDAFQLFASYAYNHSRFKSGIREGNQFRLSPDHSAALGVIVSQPVGSVRVSFSPSVTAQSRVYFDDDNDIPALQQPPRALVADNVQDEMQKGYALVNARLGVESNNGMWRIEGFVENLFDKKYIRDAGNTGDALGLPTFIAGDPRFYGISATVRFGGAR